MAGSSTNLSLILPVITDATIVRDIYNLNWNTIDGRFSATYMAVQAKASVSITGGSITGITDLTIADGGTGSSTAANARTALGLAIGTNVQAYDAGLLSIAGLTTAANKMIYTTALDTYAVIDLTAFARTILDDGDEATFKATVNLEIGTDVQAFDTALTNISALTYVSGSFIALTANDTYTVRTYAQTLTDIGGAASGANTDITSLGGITGAIATATNISMTGELDITGALGCIDLNPAQQTTKDIISIIPTATINATQIWCGVNIDGSALDPNGVDAEVIGHNIDFSGVSETNNPEIHGSRVNVPFGQDAMHIMEGQLHIDTVLPSTAASEFTNIDIVIDSSALVSTSEYHAIDVATTGTPAGHVVALGTHFGVDVIHQHISTFATPSQTEFAGVKHTGGGTWVDGIDAYGVIFAAVSDAIYVGAATQFDEIEVIMTTGGTKSIAPTFWYNTAADAWTQFFPADDTNGFQQSGEIRWDVASITATWTGNGDPGVGDTTAGYWIKIVRTRVGTVGSPDPTTVKIGLATEYSWDKDGDITTKSLVLTTPLGAAYGGTGLTTGALTLLSTTTVAFNADGDTTLYTVPSGKRCVLSHATVVAAGDAGATTTLSIGANGAETDFIPANTLSNLDAEYDSVILQPIPNTTPLKNKSYAAATVIEAQVASQSGVAGNTIYLFGILY